MKKVLLEIQVPGLEWCFGGPNHEICQYFDNEGGVADCLLPMFYNVREIESGSVLKDPKCLALEGR